MAEVNIPSTTTIIDGPITNTSGVAATPAYTFTSNETTGLYRVGANQLGISNAGTKNVDISSSGVISTTVPVYGAHIGFRASFSGTGGYTAGESYFKGVSASFDTESGYDSVNGDYVIPITGYWKFIAIVRKDTAADFELTWYINTGGGLASESGVNVYLGEDTSTQRTQQIILQRHFDSGDILRPRGQHTIAGAPTHAGDFSGYFLGT